MYNDSMHLDASQHMVWSVATATFSSLKQSQIQNCSFSIPASVWPKNEHLHIFNWLLDDGHTLQMVVQNMSEVHEKNFYLYATDLWNDDLD